MQPCKWSLQAFFVFTLLLSLSTGCTQRAVDVPALTHGFRVDPLTFVENDTTVTGALLRRDILKKPASGDSALIAARIGLLLSMQGPDGGIYLDSAKASEENAQYLTELHGLGADTSDPRIRMALIVLAQDARVDTPGLDVISTLCRWNRGEHVGVKHTIEIMLADRSDLYAREHSLSLTNKLNALWCARDAVRTIPAVDRMLAWLDASMNDMGCVPGVDPLAITDALSRIDRPLAKHLVRRQIPLILRTQGKNGTWGRTLWTQVVFRALSRHGLLDTLRALPPLPPDWRIVKTIPVPGVAHRGATAYRDMTWDGENLCLWDPINDEILALDTTDGRVARRLPVAVDYIYGLSSTDGRYVMSGRRTPKYRIYIADARTGAVQDSIDVSEAGYIGRCEVVGDDYWVYSRHRKMMRTISRSDTAKRRWFRMPALGVVSMALAGQTMWQSNVQPRSITRTRLDGRLIEWAESPFERFSHLASDGRSLWALDATNSRVCRLERI